MGNKIDQKLLSRLVQALESGYAVELMKEDDGKCEICKNAIERDSCYIKVCVGTLINDTLCVDCGLTVLDRLEEHFDDELILTLRKKGDIKWQK